MEVAEAKGYQGLRLLGLVSRGEHINVYVMEHSFDYIYTMFKLDTIHIPVKYTDIHRAIPAFEILSRLKHIVNSNVDLMNRPKTLPLLQRIETYHAPVAVPGQRVKRLLNKNLAKFRLARRKLF